MKNLLSKIDLALPRLPGWCTPEKAYAMSRLIVETKPALSVEIGVFGGSSLIPQALSHQAIEHGVVFGIDPWSKDAALEFVEEKENLDWWAKQNYEEIYCGCVRAVLDHRVTEYCNVLRLKSEQATHVFDRIDILHIDGNHSEAKSVSDVMLYLPKVVIGGHVWFDDVDWHSTKRAVALVEEKCEKIKEVGSCHLYRKHS